MVLELPIRVFALFMLEAAIPRRFAAQRGLVCAILVALLCVSEALSFEDIFVWQNNLRSEVGGPDARPRSHARAAPQG